MTLKVSENMKATEDGLFQVHSAVQRYVTAKETPDTIQHAVQLNGNLPCLYASIEIVQEG